MIKLYLATALLLVPAIAQAWPWSHDMANQISIKPQESVDLKNPGMTPFPKNSIPIPGTTSLVKDMSVSEKQVNPIPEDYKSVNLCATPFPIYCHTSHDISGMEY